MSGAQILVVEDEAIVAEDIVEILHELGYQTAGPCASAAEALAVPEDDIAIALMDIHIAGRVDGIETAELLEKRGIGIIFLTAFADDATLAAAKLVSPYGYIIKPFDERDLRTAIEIALYKQQTERELHKTRALLGSVIDSVHDAVIAVDTSGMISFMNESAGRLLRIDPRASVGSPAWDLVDLHDADGASLTPSIERAIALGQLRNIGRGARLRQGDHEQATVECVVAPLLDPQGQPTGATLVIRDMTDAARIETLEAEMRDLRKALMERVLQLV